MRAIIKQYALAALLFFAVVTAFVSYFARQQLTDFNQSQTVLAQSASAHARDVIEMYLANQRKAVSQFVQLHAELIRKLSSNSENAELYDELDLLVGANFPEVKTFTLADAKGNVLLAGSVDELDEACVQNIHMYAADSSKADAGLHLHDDETGRHFDVMSKLFVQDGRFIILFATFDTRELKQFLASAQPEHHRLYIVADDNSRIELTTTTAHQTDGYALLSERESKRILAREHVENTEWDIVDIPEQAMLKAAYWEIFSQSVLMLLIFVIAGLLALLHITRIEKQRLLSEQKLKEHEQELEQTVRERTQALMKANERLEHLSLSDGLTGIANRRHFDAILNREIGRANRENKPLSLLLFDIDFFKNFNDNAGHLAGDDCLRKIAKAVDAEFKRGGDLTARYGGEEFAIILPGSDVSEMQRQAERVREIIWNLNIPHPSSTVSDRVTVSVGGATLRRDQYKTANDLIDEADEALYQAKSGGRNNYRVFGG